MLPIRPHPSSSGHNSRCWSKRRPLVRIGRARSSSSPAALKGKQRTVRIWSVGAIITGRPNELVAPIHDPHAGDPAPRGVGAVAGEEPARADGLQALLKPYPAERMRAFPVSTKVNSVKNDDPALAKPLEATGSVPT
jgi:hypothetical protein